MWSRDVRIEAMLFFFFSSRRRHTRFDCDWTDVCSSDLEPPGGGATERIEQRAAARRRMWRDLLLFGGHTWGSPASGSDPDRAGTAAQWGDKRRVLGWAAAAGPAPVAGPPPPGGPRTCRVAG